MTEPAAVRRRPTDMRNVIIRTALVVPLLLAASAACGDDADPASPTVDPTVEPGVTSDPTGSWRMVDGAAAPISGWDVTMTIEGAQIGGTAACNSYGGTVAWDGDGSFAVGELAQTEMACEPAEVMELERTFLASLATTVEFEVDDEQLTLRGPDGSTWTFELLPPIPTAELVDTRWILDGYVADDAVSNEQGMDAATLTLHADGTVTGSTNCRDLSGSWIQSGGEILLAQLAAEGSCTNAAADLDGRILEVLGDGFTVEIDGQRLTITSRGGVGLTFTTG